MKAIIRDEMIKVAGQWLQPAQLEAAALADPALAEAACVPVADAEGFERMALFVTGALAPERLVRAARRACEALPGYKRPKWIRALPELPRTTTGKVQRFRLRALIEAELRPPARRRRSTAPPSRRYSPSGRR